MNKVVVLVASVLVIGTSAAFACCKGTDGTDPTGGDKCTNDTMSGKATCGAWGGPTSQGQFDGNVPKGADTCSAKTVNFYPEIPLDATKPCDSGNTCMAHGSQAAFSIVHYTNTGVCPTPKPEATVDPTEPAQPTAQ